MQDNSGKEKFLDWKNDKIVFLVWTKQSIRAQGISKKIGAYLCLLYTSRIKHPILFVKTLAILRKAKPSIIFCQSPPITCSLTALFYKHILAGTKKPRILIDIHTGAIIKPWSRNVSKLIMRIASFNIVTNQEIQNYISQHFNVSTFVLEDPVTEFTDIILEAGKELEYKIPEKNLLSVAVISSFGYDEPLKVVFNTASELSEVQFYVTGDKSKVDKKLLNEIPNNLIMTGYLDYDQYIDLLRKVDVIMDLTVDDKTMLAGAHEALSLEKPLITSDWNPLRSYFKKGTLHVNNSPQAVKQAIMIAKTEKDVLSKEMHELKLEKISEWNEKISKLYWLLDKIN